MPSGFTLPPFEQQQLREACVKGSTEYVTSFLSTLTPLSLFPQGSFASTGSQRHHTHGLSEGTRLRPFQKSENGAKCERRHIRNACMKAVASLNYVFHDDCRNSVVHYLCGAKIPVKGVYVLFLWLDRFCYSCRSSAQRNDEDRAHLVKALISAGYPLDFSSWNAKWAICLPHDSRLLSDDVTGSKGLSIFV